MTLLDRTVAILDANRIPHALIGAAALAAAGVARSTLDIDLLVVETAVLRPEMWAETRETGVVVDVRRGTPDDPLAGVVRLEQDGERPVDIIIGKHAWQARALARAVRRPSGPPAVMPRDLILLKLYAGGTQDTWDIRELLRGPDADTLARDVETDLETLPQSMRDRWNTARAH